MKQIVDEILEIRNEVTMLNKTYNEKLLQLKTAHDENLLQLDTKHFDTLVSIERNKIEVVRYDREFKHINFKVFYDKEYKKYHFIGSIFYDGTEIIDHIRRKLLTNIRGQKQLKHFGDCHWAILNVEEDEILMIEEVIKYQLELNLFNNNFIKLKKTNLDLSHHIKSVK